MAMTDDEIKRRAGEIAGAAWDDRERIGTLSDQLRYVASMPALGADGDLTDEDRKELFWMADDRDRQSAVAMNRLSM